jgi:hypothetical protein
MSPGLYLLGGSQGRGCRGTKCLVALEYTHNVMWKSNDFYYKPHSAAGTTWSKSGVMSRAIKRRT